jgi:predicted oxidoreductase
MHLSQVPTHAGRVALLQAALDAGITLFDHADIYGAGDCERLFGEALRSHPEWRTRMLLQTKCGIRFAGDTYGDEWPSRYDFSKQHIVAAAEGSLRRLGVEQLDIFLLHRPDLLVEPDEVADAFSVLESAGKVRQFGVSNFDWMQIRLLQQALDVPLIVNQMQLSLLHNELISQGAKVNLPHAYAGAVGTLDYCRLKNIGLQAWSPLAGGQFFTINEETPQRVRETAAYASQLAEEKSVSVSEILLAWILRHPANIVPIIGTTSIERLQASARAVDVTLSREEWYGLLEKAQSAPVP